ncbi:putative ribonuclease h protein, partial [Fagus crenata]
DEWGVSALTKRPNAREVEWVSDLIDEDRGTWNIPILHEVFEHDSIHKIQQIPLPDTRNGDGFSWKPHSTGVFTVKTADNLAVSPEFRGDAGDSSSRTQHQRVWKVLWKLKTPNKIKIHLWRACMDALPTHFSLSCRRVVSDPLCPICFGDDETTSHVLWSCPYAGSVWALAPGKFQKMPSSGPDFFSLASRIFQELPRELMEIWAVTTWAIWYARNKFVHEQYLPLPQDTLDMVVRLLNDFHRVTAVQRLIPPDAI